MEACSAGVKGRPAGPDRGRGCGTATAAAAAAAGRIAATACLALLLSAELDEGGGRRPSPETGTNVAGRGLFLRGPRDDGEAACVRGAPQRGVGALRHAVAVALARVVGDVPVAHRDDGGTDAAAVREDEDRGAVRREHAPCDLAPTVRALYRLDPEGAEDRGDGPGRTSARDRMIDMLGFH